MYVVVIRVFVYSSIDKTPSGSWFSRLVKINRFPQTRILSFPFDMRISTCNNRKPMSAYCLKENENAHRALVSATHTIQHIENFRRILKTKEKDIWNIESCSINVIQWQKPATNEMEIIYGLRHQTQSVALFHFSFFSFSSSFLTPSLTIFSFLCQHGRTHTQTPNTIFENIGDSHLTKKR